MSPWSPFCSDLVKSLFSFLLLCFVCGNNAQALSEVKKSWQNLIESRKKSAKESFFLGLKKIGNFFRSSKEGSAILLFECL